MNFSALETALISLVVGLVFSALTFWVGLTKLFVSRNTCNERHRHDDETDDRIRKKLDILFTMVRGLIVYSDMAPDKKQEILNARGE